MNLDSATLTTFFEPDRLKPDNIVELDCFIFDFDGTLARSETAYREAFCHALRLHLGLEIPGERFRDFWNLTPGDVLSQYIGEKTESLDLLLASFEEYYYATHHEHLTAYDGVADLLAYLNTIGAGVGIVSLKPRRAGERELDITGLRGYVQAAVWGDDVARPKPEADGALQVMSDLGAVANRVLIVGDSPSDIKMGRAAGTQTAAALWSGCTPEPLIAESPDFTLNAPGDLIALINSIRDLDGDRSLR